MHKEGAHRAWSRFTSTHLVWGGAWWQGPRNFLPSQGHQPGSCLCVDLKKAPLPALGAVGGRSHPWPSVYIAPLCRGCLLGTFCPLSTLPHHLLHHTLKRKQDGTPEKQHGSQNTLNDNQEEVVSVLVLCLQYLHLITVFLTHKHSAEGSWECE